MIAKARIRSLRMTPRKMRVVANQVRGKKLQEAINFLMFCKRSAARPLLKLVKSAAANATRTGSVDVDNLYVSELLVDAGPTMKRFMPRARGMATPVLKRSCKVSLSLDEK